MIFTHDFLLYLAVFPYDVVRLFVATVIPLSVVVYGIRWLKGF